jgi:hypothetical protein
MVAMVAWQLLDKVAVFIIHQANDATSVVIITAGASLRCSICAAIAACRLRGLMLRLLLLLILLLPQITMFPFLLHE